MNIILCGLPGAGKSTVGQILASKIKGGYIDIDQLIEQAYAKRTGEALTCRQIYNKNGAPFFRKLENLILSSLASSPLKNGVISLGGGALEAPENRPAVKKLGSLVYIKLELQELFQRINRDGLPAYLDPNDPFASFKIMAEKRMEIFEKEADISIDANQMTPEEIAEKIIKILPKKRHVILSTHGILYPILVKAGLLYSEELVNTLKSIKSSQYVIFTDTIIADLHANKLETFLKDKGLQISLFSFPSGENSKTRQTKEACENHLLSLGAGRDTCIIGIGGGVVTDLAGFVASTYCRGVPVVMIPTSLLAMVDASIGGKTGVNVPEGKNLIGITYQPHSVFIDTAILKTLPLAEIKNGISEMIKHGIIADKEYFLFLKEHAKKILELDSHVMEKAIFDSIIIKASIVEEDESEQGKRRLLNFGHTVAHAIETATNHDISHGRAVAIGVLTESYLSMQAGDLKQEDFEQIREVLNAYQIDLTWNRKLQPEELLDLMKMDKKSIGKTPRFTILEQIGKPLEFNGQFCTTVDENLLKNTLEWMCTNVMQRH